MSENFDLVHFVLAGSALRSLETEWRSGSRWTSHGLSRWPITTSFFVTITVFVTIVIFFVFAAPTFACHHHHSHLDLFNGAQVLNQGTGEHHHLLGHHHPSHLSQVLGHGTGEHAPGDVGIGTLVYQVPPFRYRTNSTTWCDRKFDLLRRLTEKQIALILCWKPFLNS